MHRCILQKFGGYMYAAYGSVDMDISMDIHGKSVDMDMDMDRKFHIHGKPAYSTVLLPTTNDVRFSHNTCVTARRQTDTSCPRFDVKVGQ